MKLTKQGRLAVTAVFSMFILGLSGQSMAVIPHQISYQARLTNPDGSAVTNPNLQVTFRIYAVATGGVASFTETQFFNVQNGNLNALVGSATTGGIPSSVFSTDSAYLGVQIGTDSEMTPRQRLVSAGYSYRVESAKNVVAVAKSGGDFTTVQAAIDSIPTSGPDAPSATNRYTVLISPGQYSGSAVGRSFVDIVGVDRNGTILTGGSLQGVISLAVTDVLIKNLTVRDPSRFGIDIANASNVLIDNCTIDAGGSRGINWDVNASGEVVNSIIKAAVEAVTVDNGSVVIENCRLEAPNPPGGTGVLRGTVFTGMTKVRSSAIINTHPSLGLSILAVGAVELANSQLVGGTSGNVSGRGAGKSIEDAGITTVKLADAAVTTAKVTDLAITTAKVVDQAIATAKIADAAVATAKLANGSVELTTKVSGQLPRANVQPQKNTIVVAKSGGDFATIQAALNSIPVSGPDVPSASNRYTVLVYPGQYTENVGVTKSFVALVGVDRKGSNVTSAGGQDAIGVGANEVLIKNLTVNGGSGFGINLTNSANAVIDNCAISAGARAINFDVNASGEVRNTTTSSEGGLLVDNMTVVAENCRFEGFGLGIVHTTTALGVLRVRNSAIVNNNPTSIAVTSQGLVELSNCQVVGSFAGNGIVVGRGSARSLENGGVGRGKLNSAKGTSTVGITQVAVPHSLGTTPAFVFITMTSPGNVFQSQAADATNIYLTADSAGRTVEWMVIAP